MSDQDFQWYVKQITKATYDGAWGVTMLLYETVEAVYGRAERVRVGWAVCELC